MVELSIVIPIYNEAENLPVLEKRVDKVLKGMRLSYEIIFVNDGSLDGSLDLVKALAAENPQLKYLDLSRNFGHQIAISAGLDHSKGKAVVIMDGDLQDPPEMIPELFAQFKAGFKVVYAKRRSRKGVGFFKRMAYKVFYRILKATTSVDIPLDTGDFRLIDREIVKLLKAMPEQDKFLRGQIAWMGFKQTAIEYDRDKRLSGQPGYTFAKLWGLAMNGIFSFSNFPLRFATISGFLVSGVSFLYALWVIFQRILNPNYDIQGWYSLMVVVLFLGGVQLISIGIIGEYMNRLSSNVKDRPLYLVNEGNIENEPD